MKVATMFLGAAGALLGGFVSLQAQGGAPVRPSAQPPKAQPVFSLSKELKICTADDYHYIMELHQEIQVRSPVMNADVQKMIDKANGLALEFETRTKPLIQALKKEQVNGGGWESNLTDIRVEQIMYELEVKFRAEARRDIPSLDVISYRMFRPLESTTTHKQKLCTDRAKGRVAVLIDENLAHTLR